jgi:hypothetical protein
MGSYMNEGGRFDFSQGPQDCLWNPHLCAVCAWCNPDVPSDLTDSEVDWNSEAEEQPVLPQVEETEAQGMGGGRRDAGLKTALLTRGPGTGQDSGLRAAEDGGGRGGGESGAPQQLQSKKSRHLQWGLRKG